MTGEIYLNGKWVMTIGGAEAMALQMGDEIMVSDKRNLAFGCPPERWLATVTGRNIDLGGNEPTAHVYASRSDGAGGTHP